MRTTGQGTANPFITGHWDPTHLLQGMTPGKLSPLHLVHRDKDTSGQLPGQLPRYARDKHRGERAEARGKGWDTTLQRVEVGKLLQDRKGE